MSVLKEQIISIIDKELPLITNLSNASAVLKEVDDVSWVGFYLIEKDYLYLGPFQGHVACTKIKMGKGVCGESASLGKTMVIDNVSEITNYIACSSSTKSELVVPIKKDDHVVAVIDYDSDNIARFNDPNLVQEIEDIAKILSELF